MTRPRRALPRVTVMKRLVWRRRPASEVSTKRRHPRRIADAAGVAEHAGIGGTERHAANRRIARPCRSHWRRELRVCAPRGNQAAEQQDENKCRIAEHRSPWSCKSNHYVGARTRGSMRGPAEGRAGEPDYLIQSIMSKFDLIPTNWSLPLSPHPIYPVEDGCDPDRCKPTNST